MKSQTEKKRIGEEIIARIQTRTQVGIDKKGKAFKGYSKAYKKIKGQSNVDLVLQGKMQRSMFVKPTKQKNVVEINFKTAKQRLKAENHIHGVTLPKRDFMGLPGRELNDIGNEFNDE